MLNADERRRTRDELRQNLALAGLAVDQLGAQVGLGNGRVRAALAVDGADPADVWRLRDHLERAVRASGQEPVAFTVLTDAVRRKAQGWFGIS